MPSPVSYHDPTFWSKIGLVPLLSWWSSATHRDMLLELLDFPPLWRYYLLLLSITFTCLDPKSQNRSERENSKESILSGWYVYYQKRESEAGGTCPTQWFVYMKIPSLQYLIYAPAYPKISLECTLKGIKRKSLSSKFKH